VGKQLIGIARRLCPTISFLLFCALEASAQSSLVSKSALAKHVPGATTLTDTITQSPISWPTTYGLQQTGKLNASFDCFGNLNVGYINANARDYGWSRDVWSNFETPSGSTITYLASAGFWIGGIVGGDTLASRALEPWIYQTNYSCFYPPGFTPAEQVGSIAPILSPADFSMRAEFTDTIIAGLNYIGDRVTGKPHIPLHIDVVNRSHCWRSSPGNNGVIYDLTITNIGSRQIEKGYFGIYMDPDILPSDTAAKRLGMLDDLTGSVRSRGIVFAVDNDGDPMGGTYLDSLCPNRIIALKFLRTSFLPRDTGFNWFRSARDSLDFGPQRKATYREFGPNRSGAPPGVHDQYFMFSSGEWDYDQWMLGTIDSTDTVWHYPEAWISNELKYGGDVQLVFSLGPFDLMPDSSVRIVFTMFTADNVHRDPYILDYIRWVPELYRYDLNFAGVYRYAEVADSLADLLLDPLSPATGLRVVCKDTHSASLQWDPWVYDDIDGYNLRFGEISAGDFPYPGVIPPWFRPDSLPMFASLGRQQKFKLDSLSVAKIYAASIAHRVDGSEGLSSEPVMFKLVDRPQPPAMNGEYTLVESGQPAVIRWNPSTSAALDHYNIYKFADQAASAHRYLPHYGTRNPDAAIMPVDSFLENDIRYYYFAITPFAIVPNVSSTFIDSTAAPGQVYAVTAVDSAGFESEFSATNTVNLIPARTGNILVMTNSAGVTANYVTMDSIRSFYDNVLGGREYDYYSYFDSTTGPGCPTHNGLCVNWQDLARYRLIIIDDGLADRPLNQVFEDQTLGFTKYLLSGGRLAYFGSFSNISGGALTPSTFPGYYPVTNSFVKRFFGVDSVFYEGLGYFVLYGSAPFVDSLFGFSYAEPSAGSGMPSIAFDATRYPFAPRMAQFWPAGTPPSVSTFRANEKAVVTHKYRSLHPQSSLLEGIPVGLLTRTEGTETYLFGFHLWYMEPTSAKRLLDMIIDGGQGEATEPYEDALPVSFALHQNYPNPFNGSTKIIYDLPRSSRVALEVFNILGRKVRTLMDQVQPAGSRVIDWDGLDDTGHPVASGVYLYRFKTDAAAESRKMILLK
jgi:hypothetical protein